MKRLLLMIMLGVLLAPRVFATQVGQIDRISDLGPGATNCETSMKILQVKASSSSEKNSGLASSHRAL